MVRKRLRPIPRTSVPVRKPAPSKPRKRNPNDATLRNVRASHRRMDKIEARLGLIEKGIGTQALRNLLGLEQKVSAIDTRTENNTRALRTIYESANWTQMRPQKGRKR